jgi:hypothetical protein
MVSTKRPVGCVLEAVLPGVGEPGHEAGHLPPTRAKVKNSGAIYLRPQ